MKTSMSYAFSDAVEVKTRALAKGIGEIADLLEAFGAAAVAAGKAFDSFREAFRSFEGSSKNKKKHFPGTSETFSKRGR